MSNILITGALGFLGANLIRKINSSKNSISIFVRKNSDQWRIKNIISDVDIHLVDLSKIENIKKKIKIIKPDFVYHLAAYGVYQKQIDEKLMIKSNIVNSLNLIKAVSEYKDIQKFVNIGSAFEYGTKIKRIKENDLLAPITFYGKTKLTQTNIAQYYFKKNELPTITLRVFNVYGMYEGPKRLIPDIMYALVNQSALKLLTPTVKRDFIFIDDVIDAMIKSSKSKVKGEIFNIGTSNGYSLKQVVDISQKVTNIKLKISYGKKHVPIAQKQNIIANINKAKKNLNWIPKHSLQSGLLKTFQWYKKNVKYYE